MKRFLRDIRGASAIEFAIIAGPFFLIVFGTFEFGRLYWTQNAIQQAAITGARCVGIAQADCATAGVSNPARTKDYVKSVAANWLVPLKAADVTVTLNTSCSGLAGFSEVRISYEFQTSLPNVLVALANGTPIEASACFPKTAS